MTPQEKLISPRCVTFLFLFSAASALSGAVATLYLTFIYINIPTKLTSIIITIFIRTL